MAQAAFQFEDSVAYERFMGRWSRAIAPTFLEWIGARRHASWLDVGCGTGILAETLLELCTPASVHAIDPAPAQLHAAARGAAAGRVAFQIADARKLPFPDACFDVPAIPGTDDSRVEALQALFRGAGLEQIETRTIDVCLAYGDLDDFWRAQTPGYAPTTRIIAAMKDGERARPMRAVQSALSSGPNSSIEYCARANAIKARAPARWRSASAARQARRCSSCGRPSVAGSQTAQERQSVHLLP